jgi:hypothetical protein
MPRGWQWPYDDDDDSQEEAEEDSPQTDPRVESLMRTLTPSEGAYTQECWVEFLLAIKRGDLLTFDVDEAMPVLPFDVSSRQGFMIRQTLLGIAIQVNQEGSSK